MNLKIVIRCLVLGALISLPSPFISSWLYSFGIAQGLAVYLNTVLLVIIGCLLVSFLHGKGLSEGSSLKKEPRAVSTGQTGRETGTVKWFNVTKGFGFITRDGGDDVFVHYRSIRGNGRRFLKEGQSVEFTVSEGEKGLQADDVMVIR